MSNHWTYYPDIASVIRENQERVETTTTANVGSFAQPMGGEPLHQAFPKAPRRGCRRDGFDHACSDMQELLDYYNSP